MRRTVVEYPCGANKGCPPDDSTFGIDVVSGVVNRSCNNCKLLEEYRYYLKHEHFHRMSPQFYIHPEKGAKK
jgi:hypothetical protein